MFLSELKQLKLRSQPVRLQRDCHDDDLEGVLSVVTDDFIGMHLYTVDGAYDGFCLFKLEQVTEITWDKPAHRNLAILINNQPPVNTPKLKSKTFLAALQELNDSHDCLCLHNYDNEDFFDVAHILDADEYWFKLAAYGNTETAGPAQKMVRIDDISRVVVNSPYQNNVMALHRGGAADA